MITLGKVCDQIWRLYRNGNPSDDSELEKRDIQQLVIQQLNNMLKVEHLSVHLPMGEHVPPHAMIANYEDISIVPAGAISFSIVCAQANEGDDFLTGEPTLTVTNTGPGTYNIAFSNISFTSVEEWKQGAEGDWIEKGTTTIKASKISSFMSMCNGYLSFEGLPPGVPTTYIAAGITNLSVTDSSLAFDYNSGETVDLNSWILADGQSWITENDGDWIEGINSGSVAQLFPDFVPYVTPTNDILATITSNKVYEKVPFNNITCCDIKSNLEELDSKVTLPAIPINLPRGMGVWRVYKPGNPSDPFIPVQSGQYAYVSKITHTNLSSVLGAMPAYEYFGRGEILINQSIPQLGSNKVSMQLLIADTSQISLTDQLPIPPDMESALVNSVLETLFKRVGIADELNDSKDR